MLLRFLIQKKLWRILLGPILAGLTDLAITLSFQKANYWKGDYVDVIEANPLMRFFLEVHPAMVIPPMLVWFVLISFFLLFLPAGFSLRLQVFLVTAHLIAVSGWLLRLGDWSWFQIVSFVLVASLLNLLMLKPWLRAWNDYERSFVSLLSR